MNAHKYTAEDVRREFPDLVAFADAARAVFGSVRIVRLEKPGLAIGKESTGWIPWRIYEPFTKPERNDTNEKAHGTPLLDEGNATRHGYRGKTVSRRPRRRS